VGLDALSMGSLIGADFHEIDAETRGIRVSEAGLKRTDRNESESAITRLFLRARRLFLSEDICENVHEASAKLFVNSYFRAKLFKFFPSSKDRQLYITIY